MSFSTVLSASMYGMKVEFVHVEADVSNGLPGFQMVGYLSSEVKEAAERVRTAIRNSGLDFPAKKTVINLAPATMKKRGAAFDLPIAVSILLSLGRLDSEAVRSMLILGELSLDGKVRKVPGILPIVAEARAAGIHACMVPRVNAAEGALVEGIDVIGVESLEETYRYLSGKVQIAPETYPAVKQQGETVHGLDYGDICGQAAVKRAAEVAVAGGHNLLLIGPPGSGKSMTAQRIPTIFPDMTLEESMEVTKIYSILGMLDSEKPLIQNRPFRSVHHTSTKAALVGGGKIPVPGEISLAHKGILFLDELTEYEKPLLEQLRQPLEERLIRLVRQTGTYCYPADFILVAAMNPCSCGYYPDREKCTCTPGQIHRHLAKISRPLIDRMDLTVEVPRVKIEEIARNRKNESSKVIRERVQRVHKIQKQRFRGESCSYNGRIEPGQLSRYCPMTPGAKEQLAQAYETLNLSARAYHRLVRVARTIADLEDSGEIKEHHMEEALLYRNMDGMSWRMRL